MTTTPFPKRAGRTSAMVPANISAAVGRHCGPASDHSGWSGHWKNHIECSCRRVAMNIAASGYAVALSTLQTPSVATPPRSSAGLAGSRPPPVEPTLLMALRFPGVSSARTVVISSKQLLILIRAISKTYLTRDDGAGVGATFIARDCELMKRPGPRKWTPRGHQTH